MPHRATLVPDQPADVTVYAVLDDLGIFGRVWRETNENHADEATIVGNLLTGQYEAPVRIVAFNAGQAWARDVTADIACAILETARRERQPLGRAAREFYERATANDVPAELVS